MSAAPPGPLVCSACGREHPREERFCAACGMPLVFGDGLAVEPSPAQARARKVKKQFLDGPLVVVAGARHQAEAELIQGFLLEAGVPSMVRRSPGFDVPDMLAAGPRQVLVPAAGEDVAREVLGTVRPPAEPLDRGDRRPVRLLALALALSVLIVAIGPLLVWIDSLV